MENFFNYETAKQTLVLSAYMALIMIDLLWMGWIIVSAIKWCYKKIKGLFIKKGEDTTNE